MEKERICLTIAMAGVDLMENDDGVWFGSFGESANGTPVAEIAVAGVNVWALPDVRPWGYDSVLISGLPPHDPKKFNEDGPGGRCELVSIIHLYKKLLNRGSLHCKRDEYVSSICRSDKERKNMRRKKHSADKKEFAPWLDSEFLHRRNIELILPITYTTSFLPREDGTVALKVQLLLNTAQAPFSITKGVCEVLSEKKCDELLATYCMALTTDLRLFFEKKRDEAKQNGTTPDYYGYI